MHYTEDSCQEKPISCKVAKFALPGVDKYTSPICNNYVYVKVRRRRWPVVITWYSNKQWSSQTFSDGRAHLLLQDSIYIYNL